MWRLAMAISVLVAGTALAGPAYVGTWSRDTLNCSAAADVQRQTVFTVQPSALSLPDFGCEQATFHRNATGWVVRASQCYGSDPSLEEPFTRVIHMVRQGATLRFTWPGFDSGPLARC
jgi:hypothetical protein